jgi:hypothetical protein
MWTKDYEAALRAEIERRFRERTPAKGALDGRPEDRVGRGELRGWCRERFGELPPFDQDYLREQAQWYRAMARRVLAELDPEELEVYRRWCRGRRL